ncbi:glycoside hydrolase family 16 protein [Parathielavia hyrcaniae]|uniref:Glycoside hydrolase family 16 protein n=1 Tax=Parathielavia hyrcaniae TaxID=113614 RepID=A0AAN6SZB7_9PEZI|nr:glycoside hydrolase family 16 protein [Parathielavia hyrcaniae]
MRTTVALLSLLSLLSSLASANPAPLYPGFQLLWSDGFQGSAGQTPDQGKWNIITDLRVNNEVQTYTTSNTNLQLSGGNTVQLVPRKDPSTGEWTSARIESRSTFTPSPGKLTLFSALIRFGGAPQSSKQGVWPAFWLLGDAIHHGTPWPLCGELDVMETVNGLPTAYGTTHCGAGDGVGGPCNEPHGRGGAVALGDYEWHTWTLQVDRTNPGGNWRGEVVRWLVDGQVFHQVSGADIGDQGIWSTLAHSPMFVILNVAVGGNWPGAPNGATADSYDIMMEVDYVAVYSS